MTLEEQKQHLKDFQEKMTQILTKKGNDYANEDRLSNFKFTGAITQIKPEQSCLNLIATKVARLGNLLNGNKKPNNESISDSLLDLANYTVLLDMIISENKKSEIDKKKDQIISNLTN